MHQIVTELVEMHSQSLADHYLQELESTPKVKMFYMRKPNTRAFSTLVTFHPEGITICGDFAPCHRGVVSDYQYGLQWFSGRLGPDYLASKFLLKEWIPDYAATEIRSYVADGCWEFTADQEQELLRLATLTENQEMGSYQLWEALGEISQSLVDDGLPGFGYKPNDYAALIAIQRKFAELYEKQYAWKTEMTKSQQ